VAALLAVFGAAGIVYTLVVLRRARRTSNYRPVREDWLWHVVLPLVAYVGTTVAAIVLPGHVGPSLFAIAGMALVLLFVGIHNAWDTVAYLVVSARGDSERP